MGKYITFRELLIVLVTLSFAALGVFLIIFSAKHPDPIPIRSLFEGSSLDVSAAPSAAGVATAMVSSRQMGDISTATLGGPTAAALLQVINKEPIHSDLKKFPYPQYVENWAVFIKKFKISENAQILLPPLIKKDDNGKYKVTQHAEDVILKNFKPSEEIDRFNLFDREWNYSLRFVDGERILIEDVSKDGDFKEARKEVSVYVPVFVGEKGKVIPAHEEKRTVTTMERVRWSDPLVR